MRKALLPLLLLAGAALAGGLTIDTSTRVELTDCAAGGTTGSVAAEGQYLLRVTDADTFICLQAGSAPTCASGGEKFPSGTVLLINAPRGGLGVSCRSTTSSGDVILTRAN